MVIERTSEERVADARSRFPHGSALAEVAAFAVTLERPLLRRLRLELAPHLDVSAEMELWYSPLRHSADRETLYLHQGAARLLRREVFNRDRGEMAARCWSIVAAAHRRHSPTLRLEENLHYRLAAWSGDTGSPLPNGVQEILEAALNEIASGDDDRALPLARWAYGALPRLPVVLRDYKAYAFLLLAASARLKLRPTHDMKESLVEETLPKVAALLGAENLPTRLVGVQWRGDALTLTLPPGPEAEFSLPVPAVGLPRLTLNWLEAKRTITKAVSLKQEESGLVIKPLSRRLRFETILGQNCELWRFYQSSREAVVLAPDSEALTREAMLKAIARDPYFVAEAPHLGIPEPIPPGGHLIIGFAGSGKTVQLLTWLRQKEWPKGTWFLGAQLGYIKPGNNGAAFSEFVESALEKVGAPPPPDSKNRDIGRAILLGDILREQRTVVVLDGLEAFMEASNVNRGKGFVQDPVLRTFFEHWLGRPGGNSFGFFTSRLDVENSSIHFRRTFVGMSREDASQFNHDEHLDWEDATELLRARGMTGDVKWLVKICGGHAQTLVQAAEYARHFGEGDANSLKRLPWPTKPGESYMATILGWLNAARKQRERPSLDQELACLFGLFNRPAPWGALMALKREWPIPRLTAMLHEADNDALFSALEQLRQSGLLLTKLSNLEPDLDAPPQVREFFGSELERNHAEAFRAAHGVLFDYFRHLPVKGSSTQEELEPLYRAMDHGCRAGLYRQTLHEVFWQRIQWDELEYGARNQGAYGADLAALSGFFPGGWDSEPVKGNLNEEDRFRLSNHVAFLLIGLGQLQEASKVLALLEQYVTHEEWPHLMTMFNNLASLHAALGQWDESLRDTEHAFKLARKLGY